MNSRCFKLYRFYSIPYNWKTMAIFFSGVELQRIVLKFRKRNRKLLPRVHVSTKRKNRKFHGVVKQRRQRTVPKCVMHVQSYRFANQNLLLFCCSSCRHCCSRLSSLILWIKLRYTRGSFQYVANCSLKTNLATPSGQSKTKRGNFNIGVHETLNFVSQLTSVNLK